MKEIKPDAVLNLEGVACPNNFVKTILELGEMQQGQILEVILDGGEPIRNVPRAVKEEGHHIIKVDRIKDKWRLVIRKV